VKFRAIHAEKGTYSVALMCRVLGVCRSGYYAFARRPKSPRCAANEQLVERILLIHARSRGSYGSPRVHAKLRAQGNHVSRKRVERLMREGGIVARRRRRFRRTTDSNHTHGVANNVLARNFQTTQPNRVWVSDITYIPTRQGWLYLAAIIDLFSRKVVGWSMRETIDTSLVLDALHMARNRRKPAAGLLHHSDRGSQYACSDYRRALRQMGASCSMSRRGNCWDNAVAESFFAAFKTECAQYHDFESRDQARAATFDYIEVFYNRQRIHSSLGYVAPEEFEKMYFNPSADAA
jgi:putative transposase